MAENQGSEQAPGAIVARLRKERGRTQAWLAQRARVSASMLGKVERGDRTLSPALAAGVAAALGVRLADVLGTAPAPPNDQADLTRLRNTYLRNDLPEAHVVPDAQIWAEMRRVTLYRNETRISELLHELPDILTRATAAAHHLNTAKAWENLTFLYSAGYWVAARHRWIGDAQTAIRLEAWAAAQQRNPLARAVAMRDRAGLHLNSGDPDGGLAVVERGYGALGSSHLTGQPRAYAEGVLALRGLTLAGRAGDAAEARRHAALAERAAEDAREGDIDIGVTFGPANTATHLLATALDQGRPREAAAHARRVLRDPSRLPAVRIGAVHINAARAELDLGDRDAAVDHVEAAYRVVPQMAKVHPMCQEVLRVLVSLHKRSNPKLVRLSRLSGVAL